MLQALTVARTSKLAVQTLHRLFGSGLAGCRFHYTRINHPGICRAQLRVDHPQHRTGLDMRLTGSAGTAVDGRTATAAAGLLPMR